MKAKIGSQQMARWRRRALDDFPELRRDLTSAGFSIYQLFFELLPMARKAHQAGDDATLHRVLKYAEWCLNQRRNQEPSNAAAVAFYEHIFQHTDRAKWPEIVALLSPNVIWMVSTLWSLFHDEQELIEIKRLIVEQHGPACVQDMQTEPFFKERRAKSP